MLISVVVAAIGCNFIDRKGFFDHLLVNIRNKEVEAFSEQLACKKWNCKRVDIHCQQLLEALEGETLKLFIKSDGRLKSQLMLKELAILHLKSSEIESILDQITASIYLYEIAKAAFDQNRMDYVKQILQLPRYRRSNIIDTYLRKKLIINGICDSWVFDSRSEQLALESFGFQFCNGVPLLHPLPHNSPKTLKVLLYSPNIISNTRYRDYVRFNLLLTDQSYLESFFSYENQISENQIIMRNNLRSIFDNIQFDEHFSQSTIDNTNFQFYRFYLVHIKSEVPIWIRSLLQSSEGSFPVIKSQLISILKDFHQFLNLRISIFEFIQAHSKIIETTDKTIYELFNELSLDSPEWITFCLNKYTNSSIEEKAILLVQIANIETNKRSIESILNAALTKSNQNTNLSPLSAILTIASFHESHLFVNQGLLVNLMTDIPINTLRLLLSKSSNVFDFEKDVVHILYNFKDSFKLIDILNIVKHLDQGVLYSVQTSKEMSTRLQQLRDLKDLPKESQDLLKIISIGEDEAAIHKVISKVSADDLFVWAIKHNKKEIGFNVLIYIQKTTSLDELREIVGKELGTTGTAILDTFIRRMSDTCSICCEAFDVDSRALECSHVFHDHCIRRWRGIKNCCPICR